MTEKEEN